MNKHLFFAIASTAIIVFSFQNNNVFAGEFIESESAITGIYARCPNDDPAACAQAKETVKELYSADISPQDKEKQLVEYQIIHLMPETVDGNLYATITLLNGKVLTALDGIKEVDNLFISGKGLEEYLAYQINWTNIDPLLYSPDNNLFIRVLTEDELDDLATDR